MPYWTIRTELDDAPGRLAGISGAVASCGGNIVSLDVHPIGRNIVADELVVQAPSLDLAALAQVVADAGGQRITVSASDPHDLVDAQTRSLRLLHGLSLATGRRDAALEGALTVLLRADRSALLPRSSAGLSWLTERALADGLPVSGTERQPGSSGEAVQVLVVPWRDARGEIRLAVIRRREPAFTEIEGARARGFLMVAAAIAPKQGGHADLLLPDGTEVALRPATDLDAESIAELHRATPLESPAVPGVGALGRYPVWVRDALAAMGPPQRYVVVAEIDGEIRGVAGYERRPNGRDATFGVLVHPRQPGTALGAAMLRRLAATAAAAGIEALTASVGVRRDVRSAAAHASGLEATEGWSRGHRRIRIALAPKPESEPQPVSATPTGAYRLT